MAHNKIRGPEEIVFSEDGKLYTGLLNGDIIRIDLNDETVTRIAKLGNEENENLCSKQFFFSF